MEAQPPAAPGSESDGSFLDDHFDGTYWALIEPKREPALVPNTESFAHSAIAFQPGWPWPLI